VATKDPSQAFVKMGLHLFSAISLSLFTHLFERINVSASVFHRSLPFIPCKTAFQGNSFATLFPANFSREFTWSLYLPANVRKTN
jgi:hypothetical protein